ncbi:MAG: response regulator transcription factor [Salinivirgaceae bacterium]
MDKLSIFLVDDHQLFREGLKSLLESFEYVEHVREAPNGKAFLQLLEKNVPDVVFMDIEMPEMDGITATRKAIDTYPIKRGCFVDVRQ